MSVPAPVPPVVPGYTLQALLGRGGSGEVWRALPCGGGAPVAVKVLVAGDPARQVREAALLGGLDHPHLVRLHEVVQQPRGDGGPRVALVLDLLAGGSLAALLARRGRLSPGEVVTAIAPIASALASAHERGVVHGDLSPGNILFTAEGRPVLTDLGVGRVLGESAAVEVTPAYVDPVVARGGRPGPASDVFGVAAAAFHALTGIAPWNAATPEDLLELAADGHLPDLAELAPEAPRELVAVVRRGLAPDPHLRGPAAQFALDLRHAAPAGPVALSAAAAGGHGRPDARTALTHVVPGRRPRPAPVVEEARSARSRWWGAVPIRGVLVASAVVVALALTAWAGTRWGSGSAPAGGRPSEAAATVATTARPTTTPTGDPAAAAAVAEGLPETATPTTPAEWEAVVAALYQRRAEAFGAARPDVLDAVYTPASALLAADREHVAALAAAGERLSGFTPTVRDVQLLTAADERAELRLTDRWLDYLVVPADRPEGPVLRTVAGRPDASVHLVLVRTAEGWRIDSAVRTG
ncbi:serine/threonine protein kinase [Blastococcus sp. TF02-8]|uniref:serine/threonine-protein kinase n=1 Tax=Blastococcus sp. TF02-8 TaxID=2250574 RepID=UPI000DEB2A5E|nr:serine/threonine-protein kinase [Blastococcus sp. TF02-8]RBY95532.1 serine/threonine protein kinase [Blastococcus sp. TF02-8]